MLTTQSTYARLQLICPAEALCPITQANFISGRLCWNDKNSRHCLKLCSPMFCNWPVKANSSMLFQALLSQTLCTLVREEWCQLTADGTILTIPTKRKSLIQWIGGLTTHRNCVYTDILVCIKKCFNVSLRHNLCIINKFNHISRRCSPTSVIEFVVVSLERSGMVIYQNLKRLSHYEVEKMSLIYSGEEGRTAFANSPKMR